MKKILCIIALAMLAVMPVQAKEIQTFRIIEEVNDACLPIIDTEHTMLDVLNVILNTFSDPYSWRPGWAQPVKANIILFLQGYATNEGTYDRVKELSMEQGAKAMAIMGTRRLIETASKQQAFNTKMPTDFIQKVLE